MTTTPKLSCNKTLLKHYTIAKHATETFVSL